MAKNSAAPLPRGIRNNNPLNIRIGNVWLGEVQNPTDPHFEQFVSMGYGVRAAFVLLRRYIRHYKRTTIPAIVAAWSPATENNAVKYVDIVCQQSGLSADTQLDFFNEEQMIALFQGMCLAENGRILDESTVRAGYSMS